MAQFNPDDPRYQREIQRAAAQRSMGPSRLARADVGDIAGRHAGYQLGRQEKFRGLALQSQLSKQYDEQFGRGLALDQAKLAYATKRSKQDYQDQMKSLNITMLSGLLGTGMGVMEGRRRETMLRSDIARQQAMIQEIQNLSRLAQYGPMTSIRALGLVR